MSCPNRKARKQAAKIAKQAAKMAALVVRQKKDRNRETECETDEEGSGFRFTKKGFVLGTFSFGLGALSNHISSDPRILYIVALSICAPIICLIWRKGRLWYGAATLACAGLFFFAHRQVNLELIEIEKQNPPKIEVRRGIPGNPKIPISAKFEIANNGKFTIHDIYPSSIWIPYVPGQPYNPTNQLPSFFISTNRFRSLAPDTSFTFGFDWFSKTNPLPPSADYCVLIWIDFKTQKGGEDRSSRFRFTVNKDASGNYQALPYGSTDLDTFLKNPESH
jgi:hypothetical protein